ncbi:MAG: class I SAM-dependent methyltransferase [Lachnospiraceae bacterium]|nr:class I SAM-dependent methyltransferase [Lachnospiraceae bacterium]
MSDSIKEYRNMVDKPWGKMFYDLIFFQLDIPEDNRLKILDFGAGFCITSDHYSKHHDVTAVEPNEEMLSLRVTGDGFTLINAGIDHLKTIADDSFDVVICHNVLEYVENKTEILEQLVRVLKPGGRLSIIKHNMPGRVMAMAVMADNPKGALDLLNSENEENSMFGNRSVYDNDFLTEFFSGKAELKKTFGIRTFFGLSSNNEIKNTDEWYGSMLELEKKTCAVDEYKKVAFFNHLIFVK